MGDPSLEAGVYAYMSMMADLVVVVVFVNQVRPYLRLLWQRLLWLRLLWLHLLALSFGPPDHWASVFQARAAPLG